MAVSIGRWPGDASLRYRKLMGYQRRRATHRRASYQRWPTQPSIPANPIPRAINDWVTTTTSVAAII